MVCGPGALAGATVRRLSVLVAFLGVGVGLPCGRARAVCGRRGEGRLVEGPGGLLIGLLSRRLMRWKCTIVLGGKVRNGNR